MPPVAVSAEMRAILCCRVPGSFAFLLVNPLTFDDDQDLSLWMCMPEGSCAGLEGYAADNKIVVLVSVVDIFWDGEFGFHKILLLNAVPSVYDQGMTDDHAGSIATKP